VLCGGEEHCHSCTNKVYNCGRVLVCSLHLYIPAYMVSVYVSLCV
jgi:hypothetical protein